MLEKAQKFMDSNNCLSLSKFPIPSNQTSNVSLNSRQPYVGPSESVSEWTSDVTAIKATQGKQPEKL